MRTKTFILSCITLFALPILLFAQQSTTSLVESYSAKSNVKYTKAGKAIVWMIKKSAPKGAMDGVESIKILEFKGGASSQEYIAFRAESKALFAKMGAECVSSENMPEGSAEVYMERKQNPTEYMMFMHGDDGSEVFMLMQGDLPSSL